MSIQLTPEQLKELGIQDFTPGEREAFYAKIGKIVFDHALLKVISKLDDDQLHALNHAIDSLDSFDAVVDYLQKTYPQFRFYLEEAQDHFVDEML